VWIVQIVECPEASSVLRHPTVYLIIGKIFHRLLRYDELLVTIS